MVDSDYAVHAIKVVSALARIDYNLVIPSLPSILSSILVVCPDVSKFLWFVSKSSLQARQTCQAYLTFLDLLLTYYTKIRGMDTLIRMLFSTISCCDASLEHYRLCLKGPIFDATYLQHLSKAMQTFLTDGQICSTVASAFRALKEHLSRPDGGDEDKMEGHDRPGFSDRRLMSTPDSGVFHEQRAIKYSLLAHFSITVLSSLPINLASEATRRQLIYEQGNIQKFTRKTISKTVKKVLNDRLVENWSYQAVAAATLRLQYALGTSKDLSIFSPCDEKQCRRLLETLQLDNLLPELRLEIVRHILALSFILHKTSLH